MSLELDCRVPSTVPGGGEVPADKNPVERALASCTQGCEYPAQYESSAKDSWKCDPSCLEMVVRRCPRRNEPDETPETGCKERGPLVVPSCAFVNDVKALKQGDLYSGRSSKKRGLELSFGARKNVWSCAGRFVE